LTVFRLMLDTYFGRFLTLSMRELSMAEQRNRAVLAVIAKSHSVSSVAQ
jgi:hypothetical protein